MPGKSGDSIIDSVAPTSKVPTYNYVIGSGMVILAVFAVFGVITLCCFCALYCFKKRHQASIQGFHSYVQWYRNTRPNATDVNRNEETRINLTTDTAVTSYQTSPVGEG